MEQENFFSGAGRVGKSPPSWDSFSGLVSLKNHGQFQQRDQDHGRERTFCWVVFDEIAGVTQVDCHFESCRMFVSPQAFHQMVLTIFFLFFEVFEQFPTAFARRVDSRCTGDDSFLSPSDPGAKNTAVIFISSPRIPRKESITAAWHAAQCVCARSVFPWDMIHHPKMCSVGRFDADICRIEPSNQARED